MELLSNIRDILNNVRFVDPDTKESYETTISQVQEIAEQKELDIIILSKSGPIPVITIGDYNKMIFDKKKKEKDNLKKQKDNAQTLKEIRMSSTIAENDIKIKAKNIDKFLKDGNRVLITLRYKGRAIKMINTAGLEQMCIILDYIREPYTTNGKPKINGNAVSVVLLPK